MRSALQQCVDALEQMRTSALVDDWDTFDAEYEAALTAAREALTEQPVAWVGPLGQLMPQIIFESWQAAYPDDAKGWRPLYAAPTI